MPRIRSKSSIPMRLSRRSAATRLSKRLSRAFPLHLLAGVVTAGAIAAAPRGKSQDLAGYYSSVAQVGVTLLVAVALFSGALGDVVDARVRRWMGPMTFVYLGAAVAGGLVGATGPRAPFGRLMFGVTAGATSGGLLTVLLMGWENLRQRRALAPQRRAQLLDPRPCDAGERSGDRSDLGPTDDVP